MEYSTLDRFKIIRTLGDGGFSRVKLVQDRDQTYYAAKILKNLGPEMTIRVEDSTLNEIQSLKLLNHPNILTFIEYKENGIYSKKNGDRTYVNYLILELCQNGSLFDYIFQNGYMEENVARYYFKQILSAVEACHLTGICHRDIKPENILFDSNFSVKLSDFGFSITTLGRKGTGFLGSDVGTQGYTAPEVSLHKAYKGAAADIFSLGVVLFIMRSYNPPFIKASLIDPYYTLLVSKEAKFWEFCGKNKPANHFSNDFKRLIKGMLAYDPGQRFTIQDIKNSNWYLGASERPVLNSTIDNFDSPSKLENSMNENINRNSITQKMYRGSLSSLRSISILSEDLNIKNITKEEIAVLKYSYIFTSLEPNTIIRTVSLCLEEHANIVQSPNRLAFTVSLEELTFKFGFYRYNGKTLIQFRKTAGSEVDLNEKFQEIKVALQIIEEDSVNEDQSTFTY